MANANQEPPAILRQAGIKLIPQPLCEGRDIRFYETSGSVQTVLGMGGGCGKIYLLPEPATGRLTFATGGAYVEESLRDSELERFVLWLSERITAIGLEDEGTKVELMSRHADPDFSRFTVLAKPTGSENPDHWGVYDFGLAGHGDGTIVQFTFIPYVASPEGEDEFEEGDPDHLHEVRFLRTMREYWFEENRTLSLEKAGE